jgi:hypothetical protein
LYCAAHVATPFAGGATCLSASCLSYCVCKLLEGF